MTGYEAGTVAYNVGTGQQSVGSAVADAAPGIAAGVALGGAGKVGLKLISNAEKITDKVGHGTADFFAGTKYTEKVIQQMKQGDFHGFPESVKAFQDAGKVTKIKGGDAITREKLEIPGGYKGREGKFEFIKESDGTINHRLFRPNQE